MATFPAELVPEYPMTEITAFYTLRTELSPGPILTRRKWGYGVHKHSFVLVFSHMTRKQMQLFDAFFEARWGRFETFTWVHPLTSVSHTVRFVEDNLTFTENGEDDYATTCTIVEVL